MKIKKICVFTGTRADYGILYWLLRSIKEDKSLQLQIIATGMHLKSEFDFTYKRIIQDGFSINEKIDILTYANTDIGVCESIGSGCKKFAYSLEKLNPDIVVILGDRFEMLAAAIASYVMKIPIVHIHGGETTQGAIDEGFRHSITKMSSLHFASTEVNRRRIIQMGENPKSVFNFGAPALDALYYMSFLSKEKVSERLEFDLSGPTAIITFHPVSLERESSVKQIKDLFAALNHFDFKVVFTQANADPQGQKINKMVEAFCKKNPSKYKFVTTLGQELYYSCLKTFDLMIGNSSSGILEAASFKLPVVNIGDRQKGRLKPLNVIDVKNSQKNIKDGIELAMSKRFKKKISNLKSPYLRFKDGQIGFRIKQQIKEMDVSDNLLKKEFTNLKFELPK